jgi:hypothetical protein
MLHLLSFLLGAIVMDFAWAYKLGYVQRVWARIRSSK